MLAIKSQGISQRCIWRLCNATPPPPPPHASPTLRSQFSCPLTLNRENFEEIYLDLSHKPGRCRIAEQGLGWKPAGGDTFTLDKENIISAQWSRAARGHELKIFARNTGVVQLDGFRPDVSLHSSLGAAFTQPDISIGL